MHVHANREMSAQTKSWSAHKCFFQKYFRTYFIHVVPNTERVLVKRCTKETLCANRLEKLEGTLFVSGAQ